MTEYNKLSDVTLTMIVRDELMNPAGGLHAVLSRHLPYFKNVVVLDTGSIDGTRQLLEQMAGEHRQLKVYDAKFEGYGPARNTAKGHVKTEYTLMLDADEMLKRPEELVTEIQSFSENHLRLDMIKVYHNGEEVECIAGWNPRLFKSNQVTLRGLVYEMAYFDDRLILGQLPAIQTKFLHFEPSKEDSRKKLEWYDSFSNWNNIFPKEAPSQTPSFPLWKTPNPATLLKYEIDVPAEIEYLERLGLQVHPGILERLQQYRGNNDDRI